MPDNQTQAGAQSQEQPAANEGIVKSIIAKVLPGALQELRKQELSEKATKAVVAAVKALEGAGDELPAGAKRALKALAGLQKQDEEEEEEEGYGYPPPKSKAKKSDAVPEAVKLELEAIRKTAQDSVAAVQVELKKAQDELAQERSRREREVWLQKAQVLAGVPVKADELAEKLHALEKSDGQATAEWLYKTLEAMGHQLADAAIFAEFGTSQVPEGEATLLQKAEQQVTKGEAASVKEALLKADPMEAEKYLRERRRMLREEG